MLHCNPLVCLFLLATTSTTASSPSAPSDSLILLNPSINTTTSPPILNTSAATFPKNDTSSAPSVTNRIPRFMDAVFVAVFRTTARYPGAIFVAADLTSTTGPTTDAEELTDVRLTFSYRVGQCQSILVTMKSWGKWNPPQLTIVPINPHYGSLPVPLSMDVVDATLLLRAAGYLSAFEAVDLKWPLHYPHATQQAYYFFVLEGDGKGGDGTGAMVVGVGTRDGRVMPVEASLRIAS